MLQSLGELGKRQRSMAADPVQGWAGLLGLAAAISVAYFLAAHLSLYLLTKPDGVAVFWPAAGVSAGILIALGRRARWPVAVGTMVATTVANILGDRTLVGALAMALCNAIEALLTAALIERYFKSDFDLGRLRQVLGLLGAAVVGAAVSGVGGTAAYKLFHNSTAPILTTWQHWFTSDALGIVTVAPLVIGVVAAIREPPPRSELIEGISALVAVAVMTGIIISLPPEPWETLVPIVLLFPLLLWLAARCRPVFASAGAFVVSLTIVWTITFGIGHFGDSSLPIDDRILGAQAGILGVSISAFVLAALFAERRQHTAVLMDSEARLQEALAAGAVTAFDWDLRTGLSRRSGNATPDSGLRPEGNIHGGALPIAGPSRRPRALQGPRARCPPGPPVICSDLPLHTPRGSRSMARGNLKGRVRCGRPFCSPQGADARHHRTQARRGAAGRADGRA